MGKFDNDHLFVEALELPAAPKRSTRGGGEPTVLDQLKSESEQAIVVGSDIISFAKGISADLRGDISKCTLLSQLAATKQVPAREEVEAWYNVYFDTLTHLGWVAQERGFSEYTESGDNFEAHKAVLQVAATVFGPAAGAYALVQSTLSAMADTSDEPWFTLFQRESQGARAGRFQISVAEPAEGDATILSVMAFNLEARSNLTQILFFKFRSSDVTLRHSSGKVSVDREQLAALRSLVAQKVVDYQKSYIAALTI
ncbi:hypothetical protein [Sinorhizobium sp. BG8]|uniref:hypothetical protein n=1 Tax=Sinorhizobium sp. BG8 TaxID=2613773 RepID=UPI00193D33A4|nr:hypothetical protein [Sinorhizobium sp. BG8]QRM53258.1 hypothetical protein F3Y30_00750 [Sinorhizobium sp. BG8]